MFDADMGDWHYGYFMDGHLRTQMDARDRTTTFSYDDQGRLTTKDYSAQDETSVQYRYDSYSGGGTNNVKGRLAEVTDSSGKTRYNYDDRGRIVEVIRTIDSVSYSTGTAYDSMDRPTEITYPDNDSVNYTYVAGALDHVEGGGTVYATFSGFTSLGQPGSVTYDPSSGVSTAYTYWSLSRRLKTMETTSPTGQLQDLQYDYDKAGNITWIHDGSACYRSQYMEYDGLNRLATWQRKCGTTVHEEIGFQYKLDGNLDLNTRVDPTNRYVYHPNHPHAVTGTTAAPDLYDYDANGNMTRRPGQTLEYDSENRLTGITNGATPLSSFVYNHEGKRVKRTTGATTTTYIGDLFECTGGSCTKHIFAGGQRIAWKDTAGVHFYHPDHLGSLNKATDSADGSVDETNNYYPFGETRSHSGTTDSPHKFTGQPLDPESGLYYYGARYYDPWIGRFISADSIVPSPGNPQSLNRYTYANNNPILYTDPTGHFAWLPILGLLALGAGAGAAMSAISGGDVAMGALTGAISAAAFMGAHGIVAQFALQGVVAAGIHVGMAAGSGAANAAITGGNPGMGAATAAVSAGVARGVGGMLGMGATKPVDQISDMFTRDYAIQLGGRMASGAVAGGVTSSIMGGGFGQGAFNGAWTSGFGMVFNDALIIGAEAAAAFGLGSKVEGVEGAGGNVTLSGGSILSFDEGRGYLFGSVALGPEEATFGGGAATG